MYKLNLIMRKQLKPILKDSLQANWPVLFKSVSTMEGKESQRNRYKLKEIIETRQVNTICDPGFSFTVNDIFLYHWQNLSKVCRLHDHIIKYKVPVLIIKLVYEREIFLFSER